MTKWYRPHLFALFALASVVLSGSHGLLQNTLTDFRFRWFPRAASGDIVVVAIDPRSLDEVGVWPWPRSVHAELIRRLQSVGPRDIAFDVDFSSRSNARDDAAFRDALKSAGGSVILAEFQQSVGHGARPHVNLPLPQFAGFSWPASVNVRPDADGVVRRYWIDDELSASHVASMATVLAHRRILRRDPFAVDFSIRPGSIPVVSYADVLRGDKQTMDRLRNKSVLVGGTAVELGDRFNVPSYGVISGPLLQALAAESLHQHRDLRPSPPILVPIELLALFLAMQLLWSRSSAGLRAFFLAAVSVGFELGAILIQAKWPIILDTVYLDVAVGSYFVALALDEIDIRGVFRRIAESRFQRFATSIGDGLVCADPALCITAWNPSATTIFGYRADEMLGKPIAAIWQADAGTEPPFSPARLRHEDLRRPGGYTIELPGRRRNGDLFPMEVCFSGWDTTDGFHLGAVIRDISVRRREELRIRYLAEHDTLTGLINRDTLDKRARRLLAESSEEIAALALVVIGIHNFHHLNDTLGNASGDEVLFNIAGRLNSLLPDGGLLARLNGDEFAILLAGENVNEDARILCTDIAAAFDGAPVDAGGQQHRIVPNLGVAFYPRDCGSIEELFGCAHMALGRAKADKENCVFFDRAIRDQLQSRLTLETELTKALANGEFELFYQPQVRLEDNALIGAEALIRWRHPQRGLLSPAEFMPVVNSSALSDPVACWVMRTACRQGALWERSGHRLRIAVNLAPSLIHSGLLFELLETVLAETQVSPSSVEVEVTEDILLANADAALQLFRKVQQLGIRIVFDDFGTGYASLSYLRAFPLDGLKIDRSFVSNLRANSTDAVIVKSTVTLAKHLGLTVVAEGIEDDVTSRLLAEMGCDEGQGYLFGAPVPAVQMNERYGLLSSHRIGAEANRPNAVAAA